MAKKTFFLILILTFATFLRIWRLDLVPVSLYADEVDVGYQAFSLLRTGKDYLGNLLPVNVHSLADIKPAFYSYAAIPTVALFGVSPYGVRLPAVFFGVLSIWFFYLLINQLTKNSSLALLSAFLLTISPWHLQYSRWGMEAGAMIALYLIGVYFFLKALLESKWLILSAIFLGLCMWTYHAAKVFMPLLILSMIIIWWRKIVKMSKVHLGWTVVGLLILVLPIFLSSLFGGINRFGSTSVFNDKEEVTNLANILTGNYLQAFSFDFLFINGDINLRHNLIGEGEFYKYQLPFLVLGFIFFCLKKLGTSNKIFLITWLLIAPLPSVLTKGGGNHASRLFFLLPILIFLISLGIYHSFESIKRFSFYKIFFAVIVTGVILTSFIFYQENYWIHYPKVSEKWWQAGFKEAITSIVDESNNFDKVIISQADEPSLIFFLGYDLYPPDQFQKKYPLTQEDIPGFGLLSKLDKFSFPPIGLGFSLYQLGSLLPPKTLYLATFKEIGLNLVLEPERIPNDIKLIKSITYPSGKPAFYLLSASEFSKKK